MAQALRVGLIGAGYIATRHAAAVTQVGDARIVAVCDPALANATALAERYGAKAHASLASMLGDGECDVAHVLTPPHLHRDISVACLDAGLHVLCEKPFALTPSDTRDVVAAAQAADRKVAVNHNFLGLPSYARLKDDIAAGRLGAIDSLDIRWRFPLMPLRSGPFGIWMLREPENLLLEIGPHLFAFAIDLVGPLTDIQLKVGKPIVVPGCGLRNQSWRVWACAAGGVDVSISISLVEGMEDRSLTIRGVSGSATLDYGNDVLVTDLPNTAGPIANGLGREFALAGQRAREGIVNGARQLRSLNRKSPYALGFETAIRSFYASIRSNLPVDPRFSGAAALMVSEAIDRTIAHLPRQAPAAPAGHSVPATEGKPVLVIGGTGFIGRALVRALAVSGRKVRVLSRGPTSLFDDLGGAVEIAVASMNDPQALRRAMEDADAVYHLARADEASWAGYLENDVKVTERIAEAALDAGIRRFIYTGTIASYDASRSDRTITEDVPFGPMERRNLYARSKALCEERLIASARERNLPLVIARPGIVVGPGGPLQHWGIGRWHGSGAVRFWGNGANPLPFVLVDDVAEGLVRMLDTPGIEGRSFNLVGDPMLSAQDYFDALYRQTQTRMTVKPASLYGLYAMDVVKYLLKRHVMHHRDLERPSLVDWKSRAHLSPFANSQAREILGWRPESDKERFLERAITPQSLFGF